MILACLFFALKVTALTELKCEPEITDSGAKICEFTLEVRQRETYTALINKKNLPIRPTSDGKFEFRTNSMYTTPELAYVAADISIGADITPNITHPILADGRINQLVTTINNDYIGPTIRVPENAWVAIKVVNLLENQAFTMHWHGMKQKGTWAYDGSRSTQCPIMPKEEFTYRFKAEPAGSHLYHSHILGQERDGAFGAFIVERENSYSAEPVFISELGPNGDFGGQTHSQLSVYNHGGSGNSNFHIATRIYKPDHQEISAGIMSVIMLNGLGINSDVPSNNSYFRLGAEKIYTFYNKGEDGFYELSVDGHDIELLETDGIKVSDDNNVFQSIQLGQAERVTIRFLPRSEGDKRNSYIRVESVAVMVANASEWLDDKLILGYIHLFYRITFLMIP